MQLLNLTWQSLRIVLQQGGFLFESVPFISELVDLLLINDLQLLLLFPKNYVQLVFLLLKFKPLNSFGIVGITFGRHSTISLPPVLLLKRFAGGDGSVVVSSDFIVEVLEGLDLFLGFEGSEWGLLLPFEDLPFLEPELVSEVCDLVFEGKDFVDELFLLMFVLFPHAWGLAFVLVSDSGDFLQEFGDLFIFFGNVHVRLGQLALEEDDTILIAGNFILPAVDIF